MADVVDFQADLKASVSNFTKDGSIDTMQDTQGVRAAFGDNYQEVEADIIDTAADASGITDYLNVSSKQNQNQTGLEAGKSVTDSYDKKVQETAKGVGGPK